MKRWLLDYSGQPQKSNQNPQTHKINQKSSLLQKKTSKSIIGVWYIRCIDLTLMQLLQCTVIGLCKVELPRKYSYFLFKRVLKAQPFTSMHKKGIVFTKSRSTPSVITDL